MTNIFLWIFIVFYRENLELVRNYIRDSDNGILAGFSLNRTDSKLRYKSYTEPIAIGGYEGQIWKIFNFGDYTRMGIEVDFKEREFFISGLYAETFIEGITSYSAIEHLEKGDEIKAGLPLYLKIYKNSTINFSVEFSWRKILLQHGEAYTNYSMEIIKLNASELNLTGRIGGELRTSFSNFSLSLGFPLVLQGNAEMLKYSLKDRGATIIVEPSVKWNYDPKPPPFIKTLLGFHYRNFSLFLSHSFTGNWGGGFQGIDRTEYKLDGMPSNEMEAMVSYRFVHNEFIAGFHYEEMDYKTENIPLLNGDRFLILIGYKRKNHPSYGLFLQCLLSDMDYKSIRNISVFLTRTTINFFLGF